MAKLQKCHTTSLKMASKQSVAEQSNRTAQNSYDLQVPPMIKSVEDDHIEQMIQELLDYSSIELSSVMAM